MENPIGNKPIVNEAVIKEIAIHPSVLCADHNILANEIRLVSEAGADYLHIDVMDGSYVPNFGCGTEVIKVAKARSELPLDVHLMIKDPGRHIRFFCDLGARIITIHPDAAADAEGVLAAIKGYGLTPGIALNPDTTIEDVKKLLPFVDHVLAMTVVPGFGGQAFMESTVEKITELGKLANEYGFTLCVDGGISRSNIKKLALCGVTNFVVGSALFGQEDYTCAIKALREAV